MPATSTMDGRHDTLRLVDKPCFYAGVFGSQVPDPIQRVCGSFEPGDDKCHQLIKKLTQMTDLHNDTEVASRIAA